MNHTHYELRSYLSRFKRRVERERDSLVLEDPVYFAQLQESVVNINSHVHHKFLLCFLCAHAANLWGCSSGRVKLINSTKT